MCAVDAQPVVASFGVAAECPPPAPPGAPPAADMGRAGCPWGPRAPVARRSWALVNGLRCRQSSCPAEPNIADCPTVPVPAPPLLGSYTSVNAGVEPKTLTEEQKKKLKQHFDYNKLAAEEGRKHPAMDISKMEKVIADSKIEMSAEELRRALKLAKMTSSDGETIEYGSLMCLAMNQIDVNMLHALFNAANTDVGMERVEFFLDVDEMMALVEKLEIKITRQALEAQLDQLDKDCAFPPGIPRLPSLLPPLCPRTSAKPLALTKSARCWVGTCSGRPRRLGGVPHCDGTAHGRVHPRQRGRPGRH